MLQEHCLVKADEKVTLVIKLEHVIMKTNQLDQDWANYSPLSACSPPEHFVRPAHTCRNFHVFNLI